MSDGIPDRVALRLRENQSLYGSSPYYAVDDRGCWIWKRAAIRGYGRVSWKTDRTSASMMAHRAMYIAYGGAVTQDLQLDHLCRVPSCVNPAHLEPVTPRENTLRSEGIAAQLAQRTHCKHGHLYDEANTGIRIRRGVPSRRCLTCVSEQWPKLKAQRAS